MNYFAHDDSALELNLQGFASKYSAYTQFSFAVETFNSIKIVHPSLTQKGKIVKSSYVNSLHFS